MKIMIVAVLVQLMSMLIILWAIRAIYVIYKIRTGQCAKPTRKRMSPCKTVICIGSGGHTTEILLLLGTIDFTKYTPRYYVMASSDSTSYNKVKTFEGDKSDGISAGDEHYIVKIPRSREVHQSYATSLFTTLYSILYCIPLIIKIRPDLIICNGPGTCIPICGLAFVLKVFFIKNIRILFVESFCRVKTLSLTGKILLYFADNFLVQWPTLKKRYNRVEYIGQLL